MDDSTRQRIVWTLLLSVPPGIGMTGFAAVGLAGGALTMEAVAAGVVTTLVIGGFLLLVFTSGSEPDSEADSP